MLGNAVCGACGHTDGNRTRRVPGSGPPREHGQEGRAQEKKGRDDKVFLLVPEHEGAGESGVSWRE